MRAIVNRVRERQLNELEESNMVNGRTKGASGERQFAYELQRKLKLAKLPQRNLEQVRSGGADFLDVPPFIFEVKRCEALSQRNWWLQVVSSTFAHNHVPVVAFRQNRKKWRYLISAKNIGLTVGFIELEETEFWKWANRVKEEADKFGHPPEG